MDIHREFENKISEFLGFEDAISFSSCFSANGGIFSALLDSEDAIISADLNHASLIDGIRLCKAQRYRYKHSDMEDLEEQLKSIGFEVLPSGANFIFTQHKQKSGENIYDELRKNKILVRHFKSPEKISNFIRITIGTMNQMHKLVSVMKEIVK